MRAILSALAILAVTCGCSGAQAEHNKELAREFYQQLWFSHHPEAVDRLVSPQYMVHDIGGREGVENADIQKRIAEFFWRHGVMSGRIDYQIAEGDLVATRWEWDFRPTTWWMKMLGGRHPIPIINVMRFRDGKIVEFWNHRHDIDTAAANLRLVTAGAVSLAVGLIVGAGIAVLFYRAKRSAMVRTAPP